MLELYIRAISFRAAILSVRVRIPYRDALGPAAMPASPDLMHHDEILAGGIKNSMTHRYLA